jgi:predicted XRE-type DNA-binding protein
MSEKVIVDGIEVERGSGNVFADLGLPDPEERLAKADLSIVIARTIRDRGLTQAQAAEIMGCSQPDVSNLMRGKLSEITLDRLARYLNALGHTVEITVRPAGSAEERGHLLVAAG